MTSQNASERLKINSDNFECILNYAFFISVKKSQKLLNMQKYNYRNVAL